MNGFKVTRLAAWGDIVGPPIYPLQFVHFNFLEQTVHIIISAEGTNPVGHLVKTVDRAERLRGRGRERFELF